MSRPIYISKTNNLIFYNLLPQTNKLKHKPKDKTSGNTNIQPESKAKQKDTLSQFLQKPTSHTPTPARDKSTTSTPWLQQFMPWTFDKLHSQLYSIVEYILKKTYRDHPFKLKWKELQDPAFKYPLSENISWRSIKLLLDIEDLSQYQDFIVQCPSIENYIQLTNKAKNTVEFGILNSIRETNDDEHKEMGTTPIPSIDKTSEDKTIQDILHTVIPYLQEYSETHQDEYADLCDEWITNGLHP
jgi:hypothetical protein